MNKNLYRIVFNRTLGLFQVVAETVRREGPAGNVTVTTAAYSRLFATLRPLYVALALACGQAVIMPMANAQIVADPNASGNQRPTILEAGNGTPLVNIQSPSAAGVSRNTYQRFDVDQKGVILNNSRTNTQTELGGWVQGNPWLAQGTARVILNEVNSHNPSQLRGYVEVAGDKAQLVIANPAGISCDGCGFINADRTTLTTGKAVFTGGSLEGYRVQGGAIVVDGKGMDASATNYTDLIARSVEVNAGIWAAQLRVTTGANEVSADLEHVQRIAAQGSAPMFALDVGALGGMYSQKIMLVGTEHGVGMRNTGTLGAQVGELVVTAQGRLENSGTLQAKTDVQVQVSDDFTNTGTVSAGRELLVTTATALDNSHGTLNAQRVALNAQSLKNHDGSIEQTGIQNLAVQADKLSNREGARIGVAATDTTTPEDEGSTGNGGENTGTSGGASSGGAGSGNSGTPESGVTPLADGVLNIAGTLDNDGGRIVAGGEINLLAKTGLDNDGGYLGVRQFEVKGAELSNRQGEIKVTDQADIAVGQFHNEAGSLLVAGELRVKAQDFYNRGGVFQHSGKSPTHLQVAGLLDNSEGVVASNAQHLSVSAGRVVNTDGSIAHSADGGLTMTTDELSGVGGNIATAGAATLQLGTVDHRNATLSALHITLAAQSVDNRGGKVIATGDNHATQLEVAGTLDNSDDGMIASNADLRIRADTLVNMQGEILHAGEGQLAVDAQHVDGAQGNIASNGALALTGLHIDLTQATTQAKAINIQADTLRTAKGTVIASGEERLRIQVQNAIDNREGVIAANGSIDLQASALQNQGGTVSAAGTDASTIHVATQLENSDGSIVAAGDLHVKAHQLINQRGSVGGTGQAALHLDVDGLLDNSDTGTLAASGDITITATTVNNHSGTIHHAGGGTTRIFVSDWQGREGTIASNGALEIHANAIDLSQGYSMAEHISIHSSTLSNVGGNVIATGTENLLIHADESLDNSDGTIASNGGLDIRTGTLVNRNATIQSASEDASNIEVRSTLDNNGGTLITAGTTTIAAATLLNQAGSVQNASTGGLVLSVTGNLDNRNAGMIAGAGQVDVRAGAIDNRDGSINAAAPLAITAQQQLDNRGGQVLSNTSVTLQAQNVDNRDGGLVVAADGKLSITSTGRTENAGGVLQSSDEVVLVNAGLGNAGGVIVGASVDIDSQLAAIDNTQGTIASTEGMLTIQSGALTNTAGLLQAATDLQVDTHGQTLTNTDSGEAGGILSGGALALQSGNLDNRGGVLYSQGDATIHAITIENAAGQLGSGTSLHIVADALNNAAGQVQANQDVNIALSGVANNNAGLVMAGGEVAITAAQILNQHTHNSASDQPLGLQGGSVQLVANDIDNRTGTIVADYQVGITGRGTASRLDNTQGYISSGEHIDVVIDRVLNQQGLLLAGKSLTVTADSVGGDGSLQSQGDITLTVQQDFINTQDVTANGTAVISTAGTLSNQGVLQAGALELLATDIDNSATGEISAGQTTLVARDTVSNRGLIDGIRTHIRAQTVENIGTGRMYGDELAIQADTLHNRDEGNQAGVIAARERLDIGANTIHNREQALIFSAGGGAEALNIGGTLDADYRATGRAELLENESATIESLGGLTIDTTRLLNRNLHFSTELAQVGEATDHTYIQPKGDPNRHDIDEYRWESWSRAGRYRHKESGQEVKDWTQFEVTRSEYETQVTESAPSLIRSGGNMTLRGDELVNDKSQIIAGGTLQGDLHNLTNVAALGEHVIREVGTSQYTRSKWRGGLKRYHQRKWDAKGEYAPVDIVNTIVLDITKVQENASGVGSGFALDGLQVAQVGGTIDGSALVGGGAKQQEIIEVQAAVKNVHGPAHTQGSAVDGATGPTDQQTEAVNGATSNEPTVIRTVQINTEVPSNSLFAKAPTTAGYLVETDPRFTDYRKWLSSDYLLSQLGYDPTTVHKRLGDGFYEQQLVRDQIGQLTGRRFLDGYANDEEQYRALLEAGATYAAEWGLRPGVELSVEQIAQLTSDIVWLVERDVTLADGSTARALVPQVYVRVRAGDIDGNGTLLAGNAIDLNFTGDLLNSGTIAGRTAVQITGENLRNVGGCIRGDVVALTARTDIDNIGATVEAGSTLLLNAGRDLNVRSTTHSDTKQVGQSAFSRTNVDRLAGLYVTNPDGVLLASAGRDANLIAAQIINSGSDGQTAIMAQRDVNLGTVQVAAQESNKYDANNYLVQGYTQDVGTTIQTQGDSRLQAGRDVTATAATVSSEQGAVIAVAQGDVNIAAGEASRNWSEGRQHKSSGFLSSKKTTTRNSLEEHTAQSSTFSGNTVAVQGHNVTITGSNVVSDISTVIAAQHDLTIQAATETTSESHYQRTDKSGLMSSGLSVSVGKQMQSVDQKESRTHAAASTVGATAGNVILVAGNHYQQTGSHVLAPLGDIDIHAKQVDIVEAREMGSSRYQSQFKQSGLTLAVSAPVVSVLQTGEQMHRAANATTDSRMKTLAAVTTGLAAANAYDAISTNPTTGGGINLSISVGSSQSSSSSTTSSNTAAASTVAAGGDVRISATGAGQDSDLTVRGSTISAGGNAHLKADGDINLLAAENTLHTSRHSSSSSVGVGVAITAAGAGLTASASRGKGKGEGQDSTWSNTHVTAGEGVTLESGGDTTLRGAVVSGKQVIADIGGNLTIESLQDSSHFTSKDSNVGVNAMLSLGGASVSGNTSKQSMNSDYVSVQEQSRIEAGDGGFQIRVKGNTDLKGAAITSSQQAVDEGVNTLITGTLTTSDIENYANYHASSVSVGGGYSSSGEGVGTNQKGEAATGEQVPSSTLPSESNMSATAPIAIGAKGSGSSSTRSGISGAQISITDEAKQQLLTGESVEERLASINSDVFTGQDGSNALAPIFNEQEIKAGFEIAGALQRETGTFLSNRAKEAAVAKEALDRELAKPESERDPARLATLQQQLNDSAIWAPGGAGRQILTALAAAAGGNVTGASSQFVQDLVVNYLQQQGAGYVGQLVKDGTLSEGSPLHAALHGVLACAGAAASDQSCGSGALGAATSSLLTNLFVDSADETAEQKEAKRNLLATLVTGIAAAGGADVATSINGAVAAIDNNYLTAPQIDFWVAEMKVCEAIGGDCGEVIQKYETLSILQQEELVNYCAQNPDTCEAKYGWLITDSLLVREAIDRALGESIPIKMVYDLTALALHQRDAEAVVSSTEFALKLQEQYGWGSEESELIAGAVLGSLGGVGKGVKVKSSPVPYPEPVVASNGLIYRSNPKHTLGQFGNRQNAGIEPRDSLDLFKESIPSTVKYQNKEVRFSLDKYGNIHRFDGTNGEFHWSGSTGDVKNPLSGQYIPIEIQRKFGVRVS